MNGYSHNYVSVLQQNHPFALSLATPGANRSETTGYGYDPIGQLISAQAFEAGGAPQLNEQFGYAPDASHNLASWTNNTLLQAFTSNAKDELASVVRAGTLTVSGSVTGAVATLGINGTRAEIYSDQTFAAMSGLDTFRRVDAEAVGEGRHGAGHARLYHEAVYFGICLSCQKHPPGVVCVKVQPECVRPAASKPLWRN